MERDRLFLILRWVVTPIVLACITGYFQVHVSIAKAQTKASYETLAPNVLELQEKLAVLTGRVEELSKRPPCAQEVLKAAKAPSTVAHAKKGAAKPGRSPASLSEMLGDDTKTELMMDSAPSESPVYEAPPSAQKVPARFEDMLQQKR
jgi:hypothetical protein